MGVYRVRNVADGRSLLWWSVNLPAILNRERTQLRFGGHPIPELQRDWTAVGAEGFAFEVLDTLTPLEDPSGWDPAPDLRALEAMWVERLAAEGERFYKSRRGAAWPR